MDKEIVARGNGYDIATFWENNLKIAEQLIKTGLLPNEVNTPQKALLIMATGKELGLGPMEALRNIYVVGNKTGLGGQLMLSLVYRSGVLEDIKIDSQPTQCKVIIKRKGMTEYTAIFTEADAQGLGLMYRDQYKKQKQNMLRWRAISMACRFVFPDVLGNMYLPEELESISDISQDKIQIEHTESIAEQGYDQFKEELFARLEEEKELMSEPFNVSQWAKANEKEIATLMDNDRQKIQGILDAKHSELITGNKKDPIDELVMYYELAEKNKTIEGLREWFKTISPQAQKKLTNEQYGQLIQHCSDLKETLEKEKQAEKATEVISKKEMQWNYLIGECAKLQVKLGVNKYKEELGKFGFEKEADIRDITQLKKFVEQLEKVVKDMAG